MKLEINEPEAANLENALANHLASLEREQVRTDDRAYRSALIATMSELEAVFVRLQRLRRAGEETPTTRRD